MQNFRRIFTDKNNSIVIAQRPNLPILIWLVATVLGILMSDSNLKTTVNVVGTTALTIWALLELVSGVNLFRKLLGLSVLFYITATQFFSL